MMNSDKRRYKYCIVPCCLSTTVQNQYKIFISVPQNKTIRERWQKAMNRDTFVGEKTKCYVCEDHFDLKEDMENYMYFTTMDNVHIRLKPGILPHKFDCQKKRKLKHTTKSDCTLQKKRLCKIEQEEMSPSLTTLNAEFDQPTTSTLCNRSFQVNKKITHKKITTKTKASQCNIQIEEKKSVVDQQLSENLSMRPSTSSSTLSLNSSSVDQDETLQEIWNTTDNVQSRLFYVIENNPKLYLGIPSNSLFLIDLLIRNCSLTKTEIYVTLKKINLDESYSILADDFALPRSKVISIIPRALPQLASALRQLIKWKSPKDVQNNLPIPFRRHYNKVQVIIDCLEIAINEPTGLILQNSSWSKYKGCNAVKYLIGYTPDGLVSYLSQGCLGKISDKMIVEEESDFLNYIDEEAQVMADRGFKNVETLKKCTLVKLPSVLDNTTNSKLLRRHVKMVISGVREFAILKPHSCINLLLVKQLDCIVQIVCGIINMQNY